MTDRTRRQIVHIDEVIDTGLLPEATRMVARFGDTAAAWNAFAQDLADELRAQPAALAEMLARLAIRTVTNDRL